ncbi:MAG: hypothetical protein ACREHG_10050, partial [Candidatus Saccharimonadales bacterium]
MVEPLHYSDSGCEAPAVATPNILDRPTQTIAPTANGGTRTVAMSYAGLKITYTYTDNATHVIHNYIHDYDGLG